MSTAVASRIRVIGSFTGEDSSCHRAQVFRLQLTQADELVSVRVFWIALQKIGDIRQPPMRVRHFGEGRGEAALRYRKIEHAGRGVVCVPEALNCQMIQ